MKMTRRVLALLLALCLMFGNVMPAMATGLEGEEPAVTEETPVVPEVVETEAPTEEPTEEPTAAPTEAPTEAPVVETEAPSEPIVEETIAQIVDEVTNEIDQNGLLAHFTFDTTSTAWNDGSGMTDGTAYTNNGYTLTFNACTKVYNGGCDANGNGFIKFGSSSAVGSLSFTVPEDVTSVILHLAGYKAKTSKCSVNDGATVTLTKQAEETNDTYDYDEITVDTSTDKTVTITTVSGSTRMVMYSVLYYGGGEVCAHEWDEGVVTAPTCTTDGYTTYTCVLCGDTKTGDTVKAGHTNDENGVCTVCGDGTPLTIAEVLAMELTGDTTIKYYVTGVITEVYNTTYGNMYITDGNGNTLTIYGSYSADGSVRYDKLETKPVAGDTVKLYGILSVYNSNPQMKNGWIVEHTPAPCEHTNHGVDGLCSDCSVEVGHTFTDGACVCGAKETLTIDEAIKLGESRSSNSYTTNMYYVTGVITEVYNDQYGNMYIADDNGNTLTIYGTYSADGKTRYDALETKPVAGDTVKLYGVIGQYNGTAQMKNGRIIEHTPAGPAEPKPGTEENPVEVTFEMNMTYTEGTATVTIPANTTYYFTAYGVGGKELVVNGVGGTILSGNPRVPSVFTVENTTDADAEFTLVVRTPLGAMDNPAALAEGANVANIAAGSQGYFYTWTAPADGKLTVEISATTGWTYAINNLTTSTYGDTQWSDSDPVENPATLDVAKGDEIQLMVNTYDPADEWNAPAGAVTVTTSFAALGSEANPVEVTFEMNEDYTEGTATVTVPANTTYYCSAYGIGGMLLSINDGEGTMMGGNPRMPVIFPVENTTDADAEFTLTVTYPIGTRENPAELGMGETVAVVGADGQGYNYGWTAEARGEITIAMISEENWCYTVNVIRGYDEDGWPIYDSEYGYIMSASYDDPASMTIAVNTGDIIELNVATEDWQPGEITFAVEFVPAPGSSLLPDTMNVAEYEWENSENIVDIPEGIDGYFFTWTAYASGKLTIDVSNGKAGWAYQIQNLTPRAIGEWHYSYDVPTVNSETIYVNEGETIAVVVNTCGETAEDITPAGKVYFYATFEVGVGTEENPLIPEWIWNDAGTEATATITVPANTAIYANFTNENMMLSINDGEPEAITGNRFMPQTIKFDGAEEGETVYTLKLTHPVGSDENPAELVLGENTAALAEGSQGYFYTFTAEESGTLTITMPEGDWFYVINNLTAGQYGDNQWSDSDPVVNPGTVEVNKGDEVELSVNTYDPNAPWAAPAGTITFTAAFAPAVGTASNPKQLMLDGENDYFSNYEFAPGQSYHYVVRGVGGMIMTSWVSDTRMTVEVNGVTYSYKDNMQEILIPGEMGNSSEITTITFTNNTDEYQGYEFWIYPPIGSVDNPDEMVIGKNTIKLAANDIDGYTYGFAPNGPGYLTLTMNTTSNWVYTVNVWKPDGSDYVPDPAYGEIQLSSNKNALKTQTIPLLEGNELVTVTVGTENGKAGTITFTAAFANKMVDMLAGKTTTLTFTNPANGKAVGASNVNWQIVGIYDAEENPVEGNVDDYATISTAGKLTAKASDEWLRVVVEAALKSDATVKNQFVIYVWPAVTSIQFNQVKGEYWVEGEWVEDETYEDGGYWTDGDWAYAWDEVLAENVTEVTVVANGADTVWLESLIGPDAAMKELVWKSSNPKLVGVDAHYEYNEDTQTQHAYAFVYPTGYNVKTGKYSTGTATLTATAADGSGVKATVKVKVVLDTKDINITAKNNQYNLASGKSMTLTANLETWYNQAPTNKTVTWSMKMSDGDPQWIADPNGYDSNWIPDENSDESIWIDYEEPRWVEDETYEDGGYYEYGYWQSGYYEYGTWVTNWIDVPSSVATLSSKGVLKAAAGLKDHYEIKVTATVTNSDGSEVSNYVYIYLQPTTTNIDIMNVPTTYDVNDSTPVYPEAFAYYVNAYDCAVPTTDVVWSVNNTKIAKIVEEHYDEVNEMWCDTELVFTGKTGKVTLTATANDGSGVKKSVTINVVKAPRMIDLSTYEAKVAAGKPLTIKATPYVEKYNIETDEFVKDTAVTDKTVIWSFGDPDAAAAIGAKISGGKLTTNAKLVTEPVTLEIVATAKLHYYYDADYDEYSYAEARCYVTVYPATTNVTLHRFGKVVTGTLNLDKDSYAVLHAEGSPADVYTWKTSNAKIATIEDNADGSITVRPTGKLGNVTITATANDGTKKSAKITLKILEKIDTLEIAEVGVAATKSVNLNNFLTINPSNATMKKVTWSWAYDWAAEDYKALGITLNANGTLSAAKVKNLEYPIDVEVRAVAADGLGAQKYATVTIYPATTKVELVDEYGPIAKTGETVSHKLGQWQMSAVGYTTITQDGVKEYVPGVVADNYKWTSSNAKIATVDQNGLVTFTGKLGSVTIKATATDGTNKSAQTTIKVTKIVESLSLPTDMLHSVGKGKTVTLSKSVAFEPADASNKNLTWSMKLWNAQTQEFDLEVPKTMATLGATNGALKCVDVSVMTAVEVTFTSKDGFGASGSAVVILTPAAVKGIKILDQNKEVDLTRKTFETTAESVKLYPQATNNPDTEQCASSYTCTVSNKNFEVIWDDVYAVVQPVEGAANPYGTVKVTFKATDGSNVSNYTTIKFVQPEPAA